MGRKPIPLEVRKATGAAAKNPQRVNWQEPKPPPGAPPRPAWLNDDGQADAARIWDWTVDMMDQMGTLSLCVGSALEGLAESYQNWNNARRIIAAEGLVLEGKRHPAVHELHRCRGDMLKHLVEFGLTPSSMTKTKVWNEKQTPDPLLAMLKQDSA